MSKVHIVPSVDMPESRHLELQRQGDVIHVFTVSPRRSVRAIALVSLADLKAAVEELEKEEAPDA